MPGNVSDAGNAGVMVSKRPNKTPITMKPVKDQIKCYVVRTGEDSGLREGLLSISLL